MPKQSGPGQPFVFEAILRSRHAMAPNSYTIGPELGENLVGLRMAVPLAWCPGYSGTGLSLGKTTKFNGTASLSFLLGVEKKSIDTYAMQYDAVLAYAQVEHPTFKNFRLPNTMPEKPAPYDTAVVRRRGCKRRCRVQMWPSSPLPMLTSRGNSSSNDNSDDVDRLRPR